MVVPLLQGLGMQQPVQAVRYILKLIQLQEANRLTAAALVYRGATAASAAGEGIQQLVLALSCLLNLPSCKTPNTMVHVQAVSCLHLPTHQSALLMTGVRHKELVVSASTGRQQ